MADEKTKRFREHVVRELYATEQDYASNLRFLVTHVLEKAREKGLHDNSFTDDVIHTLFCNIEEILALHERLMVDLDACVRGTPSYGTTIAKCYLNHQEGFAIYQHYGEYNEQSQKLLYELEDHPAFKAFFVAAMLLGGKSDDSISSFLFKPIQRITKYPLLFRELEKYTPQGHPDYQNTKEVLAMMRKLCSVINEARRRVEKLEAIADWQATVEGWEGSNVTDTCNELIKEGPLIKISAGNTQERTFFLFDNLLVYCKKGLLQKSLQFRGRVAVESLDVENIADGTADFHTKGIAVTFGWKVHNIAKNKWFVLIAKSAEEKQQWMDAIRREKERRKRLAAGIARDTRNLILDKGDKLYHRASATPGLIHDQKSVLKSYSKVFTGEQLVTWLVEDREVADSDEALFLGQALLENGIIHHVNDKHQFKRSDLLYRFRYDDGTFRAKLDSSDLISRGVRLYTRLHGLFDPLIREQKVGLRSMKGVVNAQKLIDWLLAEGDIIKREEGVALGEHLFASGILRHATDDHNFRDSSNLYRFVADDGHEGHRDQRRASAMPRVEFTAEQPQSCLTLTVPFSDGSYGMELSEGSPVEVVKCSTRAQIAGVSKGLAVVAVNGHFLEQHCPKPELLALLHPTGKNPPPLYLTVVKSSSQYCTLVPTRAGLGFHIKGSSPTIISGVDTGSAAAQAGILPGCCILKVAEEEVLRASHDLVVSAIRKALAASAGQKGGRQVALKLSFGGLEQAISYRYEGSKDATVQVYERTQESPYIFQVPAQFLGLCADEAGQLCDHLSQNNLKDKRVTDYISQLRTMAASYKKVVAALLVPRWPSYKPHGTTHTSVLEASPTNLHTSVLEVLADNSAPAAFGPHSQSPGVPRPRTSHYISTMAVPSITDKHISKADMAVLADVYLRMELLHSMQGMMTELEADQEIVRRLVVEQQGCASSEDHRDSSLPSPLLTPPDHTHTPSPSPSLSRARTTSVGDHKSVLKLVTHSILSKASQMEALLGEKLLVSVAEEASALLPTTAAAVLAEFKSQLHSHTEQIKKYSEARVPSEALQEANASLIETVKRHTQAASLYLEVSLALCGGVEALQISDKMFSQCLVALVTSFAHSLKAAAEGRLNGAVEYGGRGAEAGRQWLRLVASRGVLLHLQTTMLVDKHPELAALRDLSYVADRLKSVVLHVREQSHTTPSTMELPPVSLKGERTALHVTFDLLPSVFSRLPEDLTTADIKVHPVLFNKGLVDLVEGSDAYIWEKELNTASLRVLKDYYRSLRAHQLDSSMLPEGSDAKRLAIHRITQPLNAMGVLVRQMEVAIREPTRPGVGLLSIAAELMSRMGALRVDMCESGVFRSGLACSLEQVMLLCRCHELPQRNFRTALNKMRWKGSFAYVAKKNNADIAVAFPQQPPKLYQLPKET